MKPTADEIRIAAEQAIPDLEIKNIPTENELHVPITMNGYFYLVIFSKDSAGDQNSGWEFESIIER